jgi:hypothetical protein
MAGQKKRKLAHILNLGNWANKKKRNLPQAALVPTNDSEGVIPANHWHHDAQAAIASADLDIVEIHHDAEDVTMLDHDTGSTQGDDQTGLPEEESASDNESATGNGGESDSEGVGNAQDDEKNKNWLPPSIETAHAAHTQLDSLISDHNSESHVC